MHLPLPHTQKRLVTPQFDISRVGRIGKATEGQYTFDLFYLPACSGLRVRETKFERNVELTSRRLWHALKQSFKQLCEIKQGHDVGRTAKYSTMNNDLLSILYRRSVETKLGMIFYLLTTKAGTRPSPNARPLSDKSPTCQRRTQFLSLPNFTRHLFIILR